MYALLDYGFDLHPEVFEKPGVGGPDFRVSNNRFASAFVECKYVGRDTVRAHSALPEDRAGMSVGNYDYMTNRLQSEVGRATPQLKDLPDPGVCLLGTDHANTLDLFAEHGATALLTSTTVIRIPLKNGGPAGEPHLFAPLQDSAFLRPAAYPDEPLSARRKPVSAVILVTFNFENPSASLFGVLNPFAARPLDHRLFPAVPFARFARTPVLGDTHLPPVEFVVSEPYRKTFDLILAPRISEVMERLTKDDKSSR